MEAPAMVVNAAPGDAAEPEKEGQVPAVREAMKGAKGCEVGFLEQVVLAHHPAQRLIHVVADEAEQGRAVPDIERVVRLFVALPEAPQQLRGAFPPRRLERVDHFLGLPFVATHYKTRAKFLLPPEIL